MFAVLVTATLPEEASDELLAEISQRSRAMNEQQPGYAGGYWMVDPLSGNGCSLTLWHDLASAKAAAENLRGPRAEMLEGTGIHITAVGIMHALEVANPAKPAPTPV
jgi:hypothetical protein